VYYWYTRDSLLIFFQQKLNLLVSRNCFPRLACNFGLYLSPHVITDMKRKVSDSERRVHFIVRWYVLVSSWLVCLACTSFSNNIQNFKLSAIFFLSQWNKNSLAVVADVILFMLEHTYSPFLSFFKYRLQANCREILWVAYHELYPWLTYFYNFVEIYFNPNILWWRFEIVNVIWIGLALFRLD